MEKKLRFYLDIVEDLVVFLFVIALVSMGADAQNLPKPNCPDCQIRQEIRNGVETSIYDVPDRTKELAMAERLRIANLRALLHRMNVLIVEIAYCESNPHVRDLTCEKKYDQLFKLTKKIPHDKKNPPKEDTPCTLPPT